MDYSSISTTVLNTIRQYGQPIKVVAISGSKTSTYGVWGGGTQEEVANELTGNITINTRILYIPYISKPPEVGGSVIVNRTTYAINKVDTYQPTDKAVGFKLEVIA